MKSTILTSRLLRPALVITVLGLFEVGVASADPLQLALGGYQEQSTQEQAPAISQRRALELVRARFPGNVVSINQVRQRGVLQYRVRMDNEGNIYTVYVNASSGAITREP